MNLFAVLIHGTFFYVVDTVNEKKVAILDKYITDYAIAPGECPSHVFNRLIADIKNDLGIQLVHITLNDIYRLKTDEY